MPRKQLIKQSDFPYHIITRTNNRDWFKIPIGRVWLLLKDSLEYAQKKSPVKLHALVLMSNHYHMIISTPDLNIDKFMMHFNRHLSISINEVANRINHKFRNGYKWTIIEDHSYLMNVYRYVYRNPVRAGITNDCHKYPYSSLHFNRYEAKKFNYVPHIVYGREKAWLEKRMNEEFDNIIRQNLRKTKFAINNKVPKRYRETFGNYKNLLN